MAGLLGAILGLPQGIAFASLAGLPPEYGIYTAIVPCVVAAIFGSSNHVVSGPTNANSLALFAALSPLALVGSPQYIVYAFALTVLVGILQFSVGALKLGWITDFIAPSVLTGFMSGAAVLIFLYAIPDALGLSLPAEHSLFTVLSGTFGGLGSANLGAVIVAAVTLTVTFLVARVSRKLPFMLIGIAAGFVCNEILLRYPLAPPVKMVGAIPSVIPPFSNPLVPIEILPELLSIAAALSIVALGQSISIAKALAQRSGQHLDINREIRGQGLSNMVGGFFSSYLSCGSLNRSSPNLTAGAQTPMAAVLSAVFIVVLALLTRPQLERLPEPAIGALLLYIAFTLFDARGFARLFLLSRTDFAIAATTFVGMFVLPLQYAILLGSGLSLFLYLKRTAHPGVRVLLPDLSNPRRTFTPIEELAAPAQECPQIKLVRIEGSIYFGAASYLASRLHHLRRAPQKHLLVMTKSMNFIDLSGAQVWEQELDARREMQGDLYFHRPRTSVREFWIKTGFLDRLGPGNVFDSKSEAISAIYARLNPEVCRTCTAQVFQECQLRRQALEDTALSSQTGETK